MTETNEIVVAEPVDLSALGDAGIAFVAEQAATDVAAIVSAAAFLPRLQVNGATTEMVQLQKFNVGTLGLVWNKEQYKELGKELSFLCISMRIKALQMPGAMTDTGAKSTNDKPIAFYDRNSIEFKKVQIEALKGGKNGNMFGPEFLVWIPGANTFATLFCSSPTLRNASPPIIQAMKGDRPKMGPAPIRMKTVFITTTANKWWGAVFAAESTPLPNPQSATWMDDLQVQIAKFINPPKSEVEAAPEVANSEERVR